MAVDPNELYDQLMRQNSAEQDIQAIAKQISDHAEAIYQTWKSKGLTPNELLHLHSADSAAPTEPTAPDPPTNINPSFQHRHRTTTTTTERRSSTGTPSERPKSGSSLSPVELLASPQLDATLEQLVNSFVQEDKARLAARARTASPVGMHFQQPATTSPIQSALKKFEKKGINYESAARLPSPAEVTVVRTAPSFQEAVQSANMTRATGPESSSDTVKSRAQRFATRIEMANASSHNSSSWPVKRQAVPGPTELHKVTVVAEVAAHCPGVSPAASTTTTTVTTSSVSSTSEVDKEEEKLINALKTGQIIDEMVAVPPPTSDGHFHLVKKTKERHHQQRGARNPEEELESLVDRLKSMEPPAKAACSRESSPAPLLLGVRDGSPSRSSSPRSVKLSETVPVAGVSTVDYAKVRFQAAQANPLTQQRLEDSRTIGKAQNAPQPNVVSATRSRFEGAGQTSARPAVNTCAVPWRSAGVQSNEWSPVRPPGPSDEESNLQQQQQPGGGGGSLNLEALRRMKTRKMRKSPEPQPSSTTTGGSPTSSPLPHPELTVQQKQHLRERNLQHQGAGHAGSSVGLAVQYTSTGIPIRPFLTRGSVAERVLIFEKCPTAIVTESGNKPDRTTSPTSNSSSSVEKSKRAGSPAPQTWRHSNDVQTRVQVYAKDNNKENRSTSTGVSSPRSTLRRQAKANNNLLLPRFYYPTGRPISKEQLDASLLRLAATFQQLPNCQASREHFGTIAKACGCPYYWKAILFIASGGEKLGHVTLETFTDFWAKIINNYHDEASRFVQLLTMINPNVNISRTDNNFNGTINNSAGSGRFYLVPEDFVPLVQDVVDTHPGLTFLKEAAEFHSRYVHTVIARIYYNVNRSWSGQITLAELRHSNLLATIRLLEEEEDINQITDFFSYEHFYVIYCKFWELDKDHDLFIDKKDLARHNDHALSSKMIDRIFSGAVTRGAPHNNRLAKFGNTNTNMNNQPRMSYTEFVWFLISEEDKRHPTAIEYWFRCMDLDGDGYLSMYELEYFYEEQLQRMESLGIETLPFEDCLCQMLDMIHPAVPGKVSLNDLKRCQMTPIFFDTFFNLEKYLDHEQRDPFASQRDPDSENGDEILKISDWDRYAAEEYELLVAEEGGPDHSDDMFMREEMNAAEEDGGDHHSTLPMSMERDVIMAESDVADDHDDYSPMTVHSGLGLSNAGHRSLFSVTPCSIEYQY